MRATLMYGAGDVRVENVPGPVLQGSTDAIEDAGSKLDDQIDAAYSKYRRYATSILDRITSPQARSTTIRVRPE